MVTLGADPEYRGNSEKVTRKSRKTALQVLKYYNQTMLTSSKPWLMIERVDESAIVLSFLFKVLDKGSSIETLKSIVDAYAMEPRLPDGAIVGWLSPYSNVSSKSFMSFVSRELNGKK